jgi:hypothetical protein
MLPSINAQNRPEWSNDGILIRHADNGQASVLRVLHKPRPSASLDARERGIDLLLQLIETAIVLVDSLCERAGGWVSAAFALGREVLPEQAVIHMAAAVELELRNYGHLLGEVLGCGIGFCRYGREFLSQVVVGCYIGLVVFGVVDLHYFARDGGLEGGVVIFIMLMLVNVIRIALIEGCMITQRKFIVHGKSGSVALPRVKVTPASPAFFSDAGLASLRAARAVEARKRVVAIAV